MQMLELALINLKKMKSNMQYLNLSLVSERRRFQEMARLNSPVIGRNWVAVKLVGYPKHCLHENAKILGRSGFCQYRGRRWRWRWRWRRRD
ncbi:hypothetical protein C1H46_009132 [Malus baccata]|uniref:Uncharacterized protein n=1 Tax=Malus baccata TaxID=106549 RepID=A0A540N2L1_MALBA|nr:hypothetical protein C1H46_009132 [Malus baccata]